MNLTGRGVIIVKVNDTFNYLNYKDYKELKEMVSKLHKIQKLDDITIVDCEDKKLMFVDHEIDYNNIMRLGD